MMNKENYTFSSKHEEEYFNYLDSLSVSEFTEVFKKEWNEIRKTFSEHYKARERRKRFFVRTSSSGKTFT